MKFIRIICVGFLFLSQTILATPNHRDTLGSGLYFGAQLGWLSMQANVSHRVNDPVARTDISINQQVASDGVFGDIHLGYGEKIDRYYLAYEFFANINDGEDDGFIRGVYGGSNLLLSFSYRVQGSLGVDFLPGFYPTDSSRVYAHFGFIESRYELWSQSFGVNKGDKYKWSPGWRFGLGIQSKLSDHLIVRADTTYNVFDSWMPYDTSVVTLKFSPRSYNGMIGLDYLFD